MATLTVNSAYSFNINAIDFSWYAANETGSQLTAGVNPDINGVIYDDAAFIIASNGALDLELLMVGTGFTGNMSTLLTGGTVQAIAGIDQNNNNGTIMWTFAGLALNASSLLSAIQSPSTSDELALLTAAFSGNDTFSLSDQADEIRGFAGQDVINANGGNDIIYGAGDGDLIDGGTGFDVVEYSGLARSYGAISVGGVTSISLDQISNVEEIHFRDATLNFDPESNPAYLMRLYYAVLGRGPDANGLDYWCDQIDAGTTRTQVANGFLSSPEFLNATGSLGTPEFVEFLYTHILGRPSDSVGKTYWVNLLDSSSMTRGGVLMGFSESPEHRGNTAAYLSNGLWETDQKFQDVELLYDAFANRLPDETGLLYWVHQLESGATVHDVAQGFVSSPEFQGHINGLSNDQLVDFMYQNALDRLAEPQGQQYWVNLLNNGLSHADLLENFAFSFEHTLNLNSHLYQGVDYLI